MDTGHKMVANNFTSDDMGECSSGRYYFCSLNDLDLYQRKLLSKTAELASYC